MKFKIPSYFKNTYIIILLFFIIWMVFFDSNSTLVHLELNEKINDLNKETEYYKNEITKCRAQMKEEVKTIADSFKGLRKETYNKRHSGDKTKKSKTYNTEFKFKSGDLIKISCFDWSKKMKYWDNFRMSLLAAEFDDWLYKAYK